MNEEEQKLVNEAIDLVSRIDESFEISKVNTYRVDCLINGKFVFNESDNSLNILIPFKKYLKYGKDVCFLAIAINYSITFRVKNQIINLIEEYRKLILEI